MSLTEEEYDALPFHGDAVPHAHAAFLETVARLRGLRPAPAAKARVLELGCGVGANLLPMAERYPEARFLGIDLSGRQLEMAQSLAKECAPGNVEFRQADIMQLGSELGEFDYIFTHGVYSWVDAPVRDKLLELSRAHLAEQGVAYVGYKTYPAWHQFEMIRALMLHSAEHATSRAEKIGRARGALSVLQGLLSTDAQNNQAVLAEVARVMQLPDGYLWHEYLEAINHPVYLHQFLAHAAAHGLQFIGDGAVGVNWFDDLGPQVEPAVTASVSDAMEREHFRDVFRNRSFRQTLLCRQELEVSRNVTLAAMKGLVLEGAFTPENPLFDLCGTTHENFVHRAGGRVTTADRLLKAALAEVGGAWPGFVAFDELIAAATRRLTEAGCPPDTNEVQQLQATVVDCCARMVFQVHSHDALFATRPSDTPQGSPLARAQARVSNRVANRRHEPVTLNGLDRWLFAQFDGKTTNSQVVERAVLACNEGKLLVRTQTGQPYAGAGAQQLFESEVPASIQRLTDAALFVR